VTAATASSTAAARNVGPACPSRAERSAVIAQYAGDAGAIAYAQPGSEVSGTIAPPRADSSTPPMS
jgi:hypothetical protein